MAVTEVPIADLCRGADPAAVTDFVAALYEARGWTTDRHGDRQVVVSDGDRTRRVAVVHPDDSLPASDLAVWADTVLAIEDPTTVTSDVEVLDPATLRDQLAYAIDRPVARELLEDHFDWTVPDGDASAASGTSEAGDAGDGPATDSRSDESGSVASWAEWQPFAGRSRVLVAAVLVVAVAGGTAVGLADIVGDRTPVLVDGEQTAPEPSTATPTQTLQSTADEAETGESTAESTPAGSVTAEGSPDGETRYEPLPPGVNQSGEITPRDLADAHEARLTNESYRLSLTYREFVDGRPAGVYTETIRVENETRYRATVVTRGELRTTPFRIAETDVYANGSARFERTGEASVERAVLLDYDRFVDDYALYLLWFLDVRESTVVDHRTDDGETRIYIVTNENPEPSIENTTGSVVVTGEGLVESARWSYDVSGTPSGYGNMSVVFEMRVTDVGETTVREPGWVNATTD